jgi:hypothetical protein
MRTGPAGVMRVEVVPFVAALIGDDGKYYLERKRIEDDTERRRYRHRGPTLRSLVRLVVNRNCASARLPRRGRSDQLLSVIVVLFAK